MLLPMLKVNILQTSEADKRSYTKLLAEAFGYHESRCLGNAGFLQEPILEAHLNAAQLDGEGEIHVAEFPGVGVAGVAVWFGPGYMFLSTVLGRGVESYTCAEPRVSLNVPGQFTERNNELSEMYLGPGVKLGAYHLQLIGVAPEHQKKGVATALMQYAEGKTSPVIHPASPELTKSFRWLAGARALCPGDNGTYKRASLRMVEVDYQRLNSPQTTQVAIYKSLGYTTAGPTPIKAPPPSNDTFDMLVFIRHTEDSDE
ncbi:hypothetical protein BD413DRAFT_490968 [Trametes elegans]|nr:hypothetical protein BD413DRAFT_490968 [Trametes elegans]